jgi:hypothetical protein
MVFFNFVWVRSCLDHLGEHSGMDEATLEDLALPSLFGGGTAPLSPFQRSLASSRSLPPLLGLFKASCDQGDIPPWNPQTSFLRNDVYLRGNPTESGPRTV